MSNEMIIVIIIDIIGLIALAVIGFRYALSKLKKNGIYTTSKKFQDKEYIKFEEETNEWLLKLGYTQTFKTNHYSKTNYEIHYIKDRVRVVCTYSKNLNLKKCYLVSNAFLSVGKNSDSHGVSISTGQFPIGTEKLNSLKLTLQTNLIKLEQKN